MSETLRKIICNDNTFYYQLPSQSLGINYSKYPGQLNVQQLIAGKSEIFSIPGATPQKQSKTIVVSDWSIAKTENEELKDFFLDLISSLIENEFDVRFWNGKDAVKISTTDDIEQQITDIKATNDEILKSRLAEENIPADAIMHLDYFGLRQLITMPGFRNKHTELAVYFSESEKNRLLYSNDFRQFTQIPADIQFALKDISFGLDYHDTFDFKKIHEIYQYPEHLNLIITAFSENINQLVLSNVTNPYLFKLIEKFKNIKSLKWLEFYLESSEINFSKAMYWDSLVKELTKFDAPCLEFLFIGNSQMPTLALQVLLQNSFTLKNFFIANCTNLFELQLEPQQYTSLQTITIIESKIDSSKLGVLVNQSPNLKSLAIFSHSDNNQIALRENEISNFLTVKEFSKLNKLVIDNMDNISVVIIELIKRSPNLKTLDINNCEHLQGFGALIETDTNYFKNLVSLEIKCDDGKVTDISAVTLAKILNRCFALKYLRLNNLKDAASFLPSLITTPFLYLENIYVFEKESFFIHVEKIQIPLGTYLKFIALSPKIQSVNLEKKAYFVEPYHLQSFADLKRNDLIKIRKLSFARSEIHGELLAKVLDYASHIENLDISKCYYIDDLKPEDISDNTVFNHLKIVNAAASKLNGQTIAKLISHSPELVEIKLSYAINLVDFNSHYFMARNYQGKLTKFSSKFTQLSFNDYLLLLAKNQAINEFDLDNIDLDKVDVELMPANISLAHIKKISFSNHILLGKLLGRLLLITPNLEEIASKITDENKHKDKYIYTDEICIWSEQIPDNLYLPRLTTINLKNIKIDGLAILKLLATTESLTTLDLSDCQYCENLTAELLTEKILPTQLNYFNYKDSNLPLLSLLKLGTLCVNNQKSSISQTQIIINQSLSNHFKNNNALSQPVNGTLYFPNVETIELDTNRIDVQLFIQLLYAAKNVKKIILDYSVQLLSASIINFPERIKQLEELVIKNPDQISDLIKENLIMAAPNLIKLCLGIKIYTSEKQSKQYPKSDSIQSINIKLNNLSHIESHGTNLNPLLLYKIITGTNSLKTLTLADLALSTDSIKTLVVKDAGNYQQLEFITLTKTVIYNETFIMLLNNAKNLREIVIDMKSYFLTAGSISLEQYSLTELPNLISITINDSYLDPKLLLSILKSAPNLKKIILNTHDFYQKNTANEFFNNLLDTDIAFDNIEILNLSRQKLSSSFFTKLQKFINLEELAIDCCNGLFTDETATVKIQHFDYLKKLKITNSDINQAALIQLLVASPQLEEFLLRECNNVDRLEFSENHLAYLSSKLSLFNIEGNNNQTVKLTKNTLFWLFYKNPSLESLILNYCDLEESRYHLGTHEFNLNKLMVLNLNKSKFFLSTLAALIGNAQKLSELHITKFDFKNTLYNLNFFSDLFNKKLIYLNLEYIFPFSEAKLSAKTKNKILDINIHFSVLTFFASELAKLKLPENSRLVITKAEFATLELILLLNYSNKTKHFLFNECLFNLTNGNTENLNLNAIEKLKFIKCEIRSTKFLTTILLKARSLKKLSFKKTVFDSFRIEDIIQICKLPSLEEISFEKTNLPNSIITEIKQKLSSGKIKFSLKNNTPTSNITKRYSYEFPSKKQVICHPQTSDTGFIIDALNEPDNNPKVTIEQIFNPEQPPRNYRLKVYHSIQAREGHITGIEASNKGLTPVKITAIDLITLKKQFIELQKKDKNKYVWCNTEILLSDNWQPLPSLSTAEKLLFCAINTDSLYEICFSAADDLYYIKKININSQHNPDSNEIVKVDFILEINSEPNKQIIFNEAIQQYITYCAGFTEGEFKPPQISDSNDLNNLLEARYQQKIGSCAIRAAVLHHKLQSLNIKSRIVSNNVHAFVEIHYKDNWYSKSRWVAVELGGYSMDLTIKNKEDFTFESVSNKSRRNEPLNTPSSKRQLALVDNTNQKKLTTEFIVSELIENHKPETVEQLFKQIMLPGKNTLIKLERPDDCLNFIALFAEKFKKPYLFIDSPDDLQWQAKGLSLSNIDDFSYLLKIENAISKLAYFLKHYPDGVLFINWNNFSATEITALHCILDTERRLENELIPTSLSIVSFHSEHTNDSYKGVDFFSRHHNEYDWTFSETIDLFHERCLAKELTDTDEVLSIDLFERNDWQTLLFGFVSIINNTFTLNLSPFLQKLINNTTTIRHLHLKNAPWHLREFKLFWQHTLQQGNFILYGEQFNLPAHFHLSYSSGYEFVTDVSISSSHQDDHKPMTTYPLNNQTFHEFFDHIAFIDDHFIKKEGVLKNQDYLNVVVTENLGNNQWAQLLTEAKKNETKLKLNVPDTVQLPSVLFSYRHDLKNKPLSLPENNQQLLQQAFCLIVANKSVTHLLSSALFRRYSDAMYIKLDSSHDFSDLFYQISAAINNEKQIKTQLLVSDPLKALSQGHTVIIEGSLSPVLINALSYLLINHKAEIYVNGKFEAIKGKLIIITDSQIPYAAHYFSPANLTTENEMKEIMDFLDNEHKPKHRATTQTVRAKSIITQARANASDGIHPDTLIYEEERFNDILIGFNKKPIIFYCGNTGIGKSTYVLQQFAHEYLAKTKRYITLYFGFEALEKFAKHFDSNTDAFLIIDEANLLDRKLSCLTGLNTFQPHLLVNGHYYKIQKNQYVFLIGNPTEYAGVRHQQHAFFEQHTVTVYAKEPPPVYLYDRILAPLLKQNIINLPSNSMEIGNVLIEISKQDKRLTPRHLHMAAVLFNYYNDLFPDQNKLHLAIAAFLSVIGNALSDLIYESLLAYLNKKYQYQHSDFTQQLNNYIIEKIQKLKRIHNPDNTMVFVASHYRLLLQIDTFIALRKQDNFHFGLLLEGPSGIGKSTLFMNYLDLMDISYVHITFGKNRETARSLLLDAFYNGKIVIIDELNAGGPTYERLINTLVMGTDENGNKADQPGFVILATQNSISMSGRQVLSPAMQARFSTIQVADYTHEELQFILEEKGLTEENAHKLVLLKHGQPKLTSRKIFEIAEEYGNNLPIKKPVPVNSNNLIEADEKDKKNIQPLIFNKKVLLTVFYMQWLKDSSVGLLLNQPRSGHTKKIDEAFREILSANDQTLENKLDELKSNTNTWLNRSFANCSERFFAVKALARRLSVFKTLIHNPELQYSFADQLTKKLNEWKSTLDNLPATKGLLAMKKLFEIQENNVANNTVGSNFHQNIALFYELKMLAEERLAGTDITQLYYKIRMFTPGRTSDSQRFYEEITSCDIHKIVCLEKSSQPALQINPN